MSAIFAGSTNNPFLHTMWPNSIPNGVQKMYFLEFSSIWWCLHLSSISQRFSKWSLIRWYTVHSSIYTYRNFWIKYLNVTTTTWENITGAFLIPKGAQKMHFFEFNAIWCGRHLSSISHRFTKWSLTRPYTVQSSIYTCRNFWMKSLNVATITLEKMAGAIFSPNDIMVYW